MNKLKKKKFKIIKEMIIHLSGSVAMLAAAAFTGIWLGLKETNDMDHYINEVKEAVDNEEWAALYSFSQTENTGSFINDYYFGLAMDDIMGDKEGKTVIDDIKDKGDTCEVGLSYKNNKGEKEKVTFHMYRDNEKKKYIFFHPWNVSIDDYIIKDCSITTYGNLQAYFDGTELTGENTVFTDNGDGTVTYLLENLFMGKHELTLKGEHIAEKNQEINFDKSGENFQVSATDFCISDDDRADIEVKTQNIVVGMYEAVMNKKGTQDVSGQFVQNEAVIANVDNVYDSMLSALSPDDGSTCKSINSMTFVNFEITDYIIDTGMTVMATYDCEYTARGSRKSMGGVRETYSGTTQGAAKLHFTKNEGDYKCDVLEMGFIDYSKKTEEQTTEQGAGQ